MSSPSPSLYAQLRSQFAPPAAFREGRDTPAEQLLQAIWQHQRIHRNTLQTADGQPLFILHPGFLNREPGPDFLRAIVQIGNAPPRTGDIEVDPKPRDWLHHKHDKNPVYANVLLHVVWNAPASTPDPAGLPQLALEPVLDDSLASLSVWLHHGPTAETPPFLRGKCSALLGKLDPRQLEDLVSQAAWLRFECRAEQFKARAKESGWSQALWEGLFRALGYKNNIWPMLRLAELRARWHRKGATPLEHTARLFGLGGLLPAELPSVQSDSVGYLRKLWDCWWREQDEFADCALPANAWRLSGMRPANHPHRRLALAAHWASAGDLPEQLRAWSQSPAADPRLPDTLLTLLQPRPDPFWSRHYTLRSQSVSKPIPLLGAARVTDIAANAVLPWLWARASQGRRTRLQAEMQRRYLAWPAGSDNAVLKLARQRLFGPHKPGLPARMAMQQGLHQIVGDYCDRSNSLCEDCRFPEVIQRVVAQQFKFELSLPNLNQ